MKNDDGVKGKSRWHALDSRVFSDKAFYIAVFMVFLSLTAGYMVSLGYHLAKADKALYTGSDGTLYIILAEALSSGRGYREIHLVEEPSSNVQPGLPLLLVPIVGFFGRNVPMIKLLITVMGLLSAWFFYVLFRDLAGRKLALAIAFLCGVSVGILYYSHEIMTEIPYLLFSLLALLFIRRYFESEEFSIRIATLCVLFIWLSYFTRALGISLVAGFVFYFIVERLLRRTNRNLKQVLLAILVIVIPIGLWAYRCNMAQAFVRIASGGYGMTVGATGAMTNMLRRIEVHISLHVAGRFLGIPIVPIALCGIVWCLSRRRTVVEYYVIIFILILSVITGPAEKYTGDKMVHVRRYLVPMIPFIIYYFIMGAKYILEALTSLDKRKLLGILALLLSASLLVMISYLRTERGIGSFLVDYLSILVLIAVIVVFAVLSTSAKFRSTISKYSTKANWILLSSFLGLAILNNLTLVILHTPEGSIRKTPAWDEYINIGEWVKENTNTESIVMCRKPRLFYYWTGRKVAMYPFSYDTNEVVESVYDQHIDYIVVDSFLWTDTTQRYLIPALVKNKDKFSVVYRRGNSLLLHVKAADNRD